ncbi:MAG: nitronate monooxygenase [Paenibacillus sp.]|jgi:nitronate monooxygenase|nr:nitronate monooxygenase [Paenibacillus sp.]
MLDTELTRKLGIAFPILQAPMAGGPTTPELVAAVSNAGGMGNLGAGYLSPDQIRSAVTDIRQRTDRPFGVNLFIPDQAGESDAATSDMNDYLDRFRTKFGIATHPSIVKVAESFEEQAAVLLELNVPVFSFTFGIPPLDLIEAMRQRGTFVIGTATTVEEGIRLEKAGVDAIVAQGSEAGGHRGTFVHQAADSLIGTMALVPQMVDQASVPVIASGGIMDGRGLVASLALGASAVQMGTVFLASPESGAHAAYKQQIMASNEDMTEVTQVYSGKAARGIRTAFMNEMRGYSGPIPAYPIQNAMTRDIRQAAAKANDPEYMSLWAGQGLRLAKNVAAAEVVKQTVDQAQAIMKAFQA